MSEKAIIYSTHGRLDPRVADVCRRRLRAAAEYSGVPIICVSQGPVHFGDERIDMGPLGLGPESMYSQLAAGLGRAVELGAAWSFIAEHNVLYPEGFFNYGPDGPADRDDLVFYQRHGYGCNSRGFWAWDQPLCSNLAGPTATLWEAFKYRLEQVRAGTRIVWSEPGRQEGDPWKMIPAWNEQPWVDVRHGSNLTGGRESPTGSYLDKIEPWGAHAELIKTLGLKGATQ